MVDNNAHLPYTPQQIEGAIQIGVQYAVNALLSNTNLDNERGSPDFGVSQQGDEDMPKRLKERVEINGKEKWVTGYTRQDLYDSYITLLVNAGVIEYVDDDDDIPLLRDYMGEYYGTFRKNQAGNTTINRERIIDNHIYPAWGDRRIDKIKTSDLQRWFDDLSKTYAHETLLKIKNTMNPVFDAAVEDEILTRNPLRSNRLEIGGKDTVSHVALPKDKMREIKDSIPLLDGDVQTMAVLLAYTGMRFEEILGLRWEDFSDDFISVQRAVVHPKRHLPEIKSTKTKSSERIIPFFPEVKAVLSPAGKTGFLLHQPDDPTGEKPMTYSVARRVFEKIRKTFNIKNFSAHDFRDTCATEWREAGIPLDVIARMLGHSKTDITEKKYVKYRPDLFVTTCDTSKTKEKQCIEPYPGMPVCDSKGLVSQSQTPKQKKKRPRTH